MNRAEFRIDLYWIGLRLCWTQRKLLRHLQFFFLKPDLMNSEDVYFWLNNKAQMLTVILNHFLLHHLKCIMYVFENRRKLWLEIGCTQRKKFRCCTDWSAIEKFINQSGPLNKWTNQRPQFYYVKQQSEWITEYLIWYVFTSLLLPYETRNLNQFCPRVTVWDFF